MRIISSFHDYYDVGMSQGMDMETVYLRETKRVKEGNSRFNRPYMICGQVLHAYNIGFCGRFYRCIRWMGDYYYSYDRLKEAFIVRELDIDEKISRYRWNYRAGVYEYLNPQTKVKQEKHTPRIVRKAKKQRLQRRIDANNKTITLFEQYDSPIVVIGCQGEILINDRLNQYQFQKIKDPYTCYQELFMWFANKARPEPPIPDNLTQKEWAEIKGFDKWSFRKEPSKKKNK